jgi:hypothetical protein
LIKLVVFLCAQEDFLLNPKVKFLNSALENYVFLLIVVYQPVPHILVLFSKMYPWFALVENVLRNCVVRSFVEMQVFVPLRILYEISLVKLVIMELAVNQPVILLPASQVIRNQCPICTHAMNAVMPIAARRWFAVIIVVLLAGIQKRALPLSGALPALAQTQTAVPQILVLITVALQERKI